MEQSERIWLDRYRAGDRQALAALVEQYRRPLYGFILRMTEGRGDADDIFQETWARAIRKLPGFRPDNLLGWLFRIAHNLVVDEARRHSKYRDAYYPADPEAPGIEACPDPAAGPDIRLFNKEIGERIRAAVAALPEEQREVFLMRTEAELPFREIARIQGVSLNTALGRMHYAVRRLRTRLEEEHPTEPCPESAKTGHPKKDGPKGR